jgi:uridine kinase
VHHIVSNPKLESDRAGEVIVERVRRIRSERGEPVLVALDGQSGAGKSTIATRVASAVAATLVPADDFFAATIPDAEWEARSPSERAADALEWRRLRREALEPLLAGRPARWVAFDFAAGCRPDGTYAMQAASTKRSPAPVIVLDGAYTARPELADLIDLAVLVTAAPDVRRARLIAREEAAFLAAWHARWDPAEAYYFTHVCPPERFDLVVMTA